MMVPQKCQYRPKLGSVSNDRPSKYGTSHGDYVEQNIVQDSELYYFGSNTYDEEYDL